MIDRKAGLVEFNPEDYADQVTGNLRSNHSSSLRRQVEIVAAQWKTMLCPLSDKTDPNTLSAISLSIGETMEKGGFPQLAAACFKLGFKTTQDRALQGECAAKFLFCAQQGGLLENQDWLQRESDALITAQETVRQIRAALESGFSLESHELANKLHNWPETLRIAPAYRVAYIHTIRAASDINASVGDRK